MSIERLNEIMFIIMILISAAYYHPFKWRTDFWMDENYYIPYTLCGLMLGLTGWFVFCENAYWPIQGTLALIMFFNGRACRTVKSFRLMVESSRKKR